MSGTYYWSVEEQGGRHASGTIRSTGVTTAREQLLGGLLPEPLLRLLEHPKVWLIVRDRISVDARLAWDMENRLKVGTIPARGS